MDTSSIKSSNSVVPTVTNTEHIFKLLLKHKVSFKNIHICFYVIYEKVKSFLKLTKKNLKQIF